MDRKECMGYETVRMGEKKKLLLLTDKNNYFTSKFDGTQKTHFLNQVDIVKIMEKLQCEFEVEHETFDQLDLRKKYQGWYIVYGSTEERGLFYKGYIEDILLKLYLDGAVLIPGFEYFRAHGNKCFQEMMRNQFRNKKVKNLKSEIIGRYDDLDVFKYRDFPYVVKSSSGSGSAGVRLVKTPEELKKAVKKLSKSFYYDYYFTRFRDLGYIRMIWKFKVWLYNRLKRTQNLNNPNKWFYANKVIIQDYIEDLESDYKVLYYFGKYYILNRKNRKKDFRASGSGMFQFPSSVEEVKPILEFARLCVTEIHAPMASLDIAMKADECFLIEFQCLCFGPYTIQYADWHFEVNDKQEWIRVEGRSDIETEIARSLRDFILTECVC